MINEQEQTIGCVQFEELLTDYIERTLDGSLQRSAAAHVLACPVCHSLLNDVRNSLEACHQIAAPRKPLTRLEARILSATTPRTAMACDDFESHLTDYLDGFLPAGVFHRWERHAAVCTSCEDLPGMVVRSIGACYTYKTEELAVPEGLLGRIFDATSRAAELKIEKRSAAAVVRDWVRLVRFPVGMPHLAPVAMMLLVAFLVFSQTISADGTLTDVYHQGVQLAESTYMQGSRAFSGSESSDAIRKDPVSGTTFVDNGGAR